MANIRQLTQAGANKKWQELTIVIPVHNRAEKVRETLTSISRQNMLPGRLILVDDHSTDGTQATLESYAGEEKRFEILILQSHGHGACAARNRGLKEVKTEWTMFFDSDDIMLPHHVFNLQQKVSDGQEAQLVGWDVLRCELDGSVRRLPFHTVDIMWHNIMHGTLATQRYAARTDLFRRAGGWNENQPIWNDIELGHRILALDPVVAKCEQEASVRIVANTSSITGTSWTSRYDDYIIACDNLRKTIGGENSQLIDLKMAILAGDMARENPSIGRSLYEAIENRNFPTRLAYLWRKAGLRGAARVFRPFFDIKSKR